MPDSAMPSYVADAVADFVEQRCRTQLGKPGRTDESVLGRLTLVDAYRGARRHGRHMTADNLALAVLETAAASWRDDPAFEEAWLPWLGETPPANRRSPGV